MTEYAVKPGGTSKWIADTTANDSDKDWITPAGKIRIFDFMHVEFTASATVGSRYIKLMVYNASSVMIYSFARTAAIAATSTGCYEAWPLATYSTTTAQIPFYSGTDPSVAMRFPFPLNGIACPELFRFRILDSNTVDAAVDDMNVYLHYIEYDA